MRLARLLYVSRPERWLGELIQIYSPEECERSGGVASILETVEELANLLSTIPATRYARTLRLMLSHQKRRFGPQNASRASVSTTRSGSDTSQQTLISPHQQHGPVVYTGDQGYPGGMPPPPGHHRMMSGESNYPNPVYIPQGGPRQFAPILNGGHGPMPLHMQDVITPTEYQMFDYPPDQPMPIWLSEDNLGDAGYGLESFILPPQHESQIW